MIDFNQTSISTSPMYTLPVILFSAWSKHLDVFEKGHYTASQLVAIVKVLKNVGLSFSKLSFKLAFVYILPQSSDLFTKSSDMLNKNTLGVKKVQGQ